MQNTYHDINVIYDKELAENLLVIDNLVKNSFVNYMELYICHIVPTR